jgi:hypothetical protein
MQLSASAFALPDKKAAKAEPHLIAADDEHFARVAAAIRDQIARLTARLVAERRAPAGLGQKALDRDQNIRRLSAQIRSLERYSVDACLGRVTPAHGEAVYIGRFGLSDADGRRLLIDWRAPAAEPFFAATHAQPQGLIARRRYRWNRGRISDYWDEAFTDDIPADVVLDDDSALLASLGRTRTGRMHDVLTTIQADQDAAIRADARGALVVDGGPGTGKTVVALHRAAYLLYADPQLSAGRGGVLVVGPHEPYLAYVEDVLPSLGEEGVLTATLREMLPEGAVALAELDPEVSRLKADAEMVRVVERAASFYESPPVEALVIETPIADLLLTPDDWADAFDSAESGIPHNEARAQVWQTVRDILFVRLARAVGEEDIPARAAADRMFAQNRTLTGVFDRAWPLLDPVELVASLWANPGFLRRCAPRLTAAEVGALQRDAPRAWTVDDLPLLDTARARVGDPGVERRQRERERALAAQQEEMENVIDHLIEADDSELKLMTMLRGADARESLIDDSELPPTDADALAGPFAHVIVDEAQELTDAQWAMLLRRCPSRSFTIVGDRAQARHGFPESWADRLARAGLRNIRSATLSVNYRTPEEVMDAAAPVIREVLPDANVPTSIRRSGMPVRQAALAELDAELDAWLRVHEEGVACVIGTPEFVAELSPRDRVSALTPVLAKGLEFDLVVLVDPESFGSGIEGAVDRYVSMTRTTGELVTLA